MRITALFFGATADVAGKRRIVLELAPGSIASDIFERLLAENPLLAKHRLLYSVNHQYATGAEILADGDEMAIFTAVSGG